jgi:hypothetical protein
VDKSSIVEKTSYFETDQVEDAIKNQKMSFGHYWAEGS